jgi:hypothetical protein
MKSHRAILLALLALPLSPLRAQTVDLLATSGEPRHDINQDGVRMLGTLAQAQMLVAERDGRVTPTMRSIMNAGMEAFQKRDWTRAYRLITRLHTLLEGKAVTEATEVGAAVDFKLERKIIAPGERMGGRIEFLYALGACPSNRCGSHVHSCCAPTRSIAALGDGRGVPHAMEPEERVHRPVTRRDDTA